MKWLLGVVLLGAVTAGCAQPGYYRRGPSIGMRSSYWVSPCGRGGWVYCSQHPAADDDQQAIEEAQLVNVDSWLPPRNPPPPRSSPPPEPRVPFDPGAALAALHDVDLAPCAGRGAPRGYGHAKVTFGGDGDAKSVVIDGPQGMTKDAVACVGERLATAEVPEFDGAPITVGSTYLVK